jgi:fructokinase
MTVVCHGELLIDLVAPGEHATLAAAPAFARAPGGAPANVAVGLARLGVAAAFLGQVGADPFGDFLVATLRDNDVTPGGGREFLFYRSPSADTLYAPADVDAELVRGAQAFHFGSVTLTAEPARSATRHAVELARRAGALISYDPNLREVLWSDLGRARRELAWGWAQATIVKATDEEACFVAGCDDPDAAVAALWHDGLRVVALTRGARGCRYRSADGGSGDVPAPAVTEIDPLGAGDAFTAGLLRALLATPRALAEAAALREACRFANMVGALATTRRGAIPALPDAAEVADAIASQVR